MSGIFGFSAVQGAEKRQMTLDALTYWNKKYGNGAKFVIQDNKPKKFAEFSPSRPKDIAWVDTDLTKEKEYQSWEDFQKEQVEDLSLVIM